MKFRLLIVFLFLAVVCRAGTDPKEGRTATAPPTVVFMSDFGAVDDSVAICKGVMYGIVPALRIIDLSHQVHPYSIVDAARFLAGTAPYYPAGTVFLVVVDPGVGSLRKPVVARSKRGQFFVVPDNGVLTLIAQKDGIDIVREITNTEWMIGSALSSTFHGRDIFAPVAAHLAAGKDWTGVGPELKEWMLLKTSSATTNGQGILGEIIALDGPFGNLITNISAEEFSTLQYELKQPVRAKIADRDFYLPLVKTFSDVPLKQPLFYIDSRGRLGLAINQGSFADTYKIQPPQPILIYRKQ